LPLRRLIASLCFLAGPAFAGAPCAQTLPALRDLLADPLFPLEWNETSMDDGKPMLFSILERDGALFLRFVKKGEGLWAEGVVSVCPKGAALEARLAGPGIHIGPAANWMVRSMLRGGAHLSLTRMGQAHLRVATPGWNAVFVSAE
jgi:hypothetical protein